jgi:ankyrin repeat protein
MQVCLTPRVTTNSPVTLFQPNKAQNDKAGATPLYAAALQGDLAMVDILLAAGADPNFVCVSFKPTLVTAHHAI